jgi:hypothetical protein
VITSGIPNDVDAEAIHRKYGKIRTFKAEKLEETAAAISNRHEELWKFWMDNFIKPKVRRSLKREAKPKQL